MSGLSIGGIRPSQSEFIAEETVITVTSNVDHPRLFFISGEFGPLEAGLPVQLPLWLALTLRKKGKCKFKIPSWMTVASLEIFIQNEKEETSLEPLPFHYMEIARLLLHNAREDVDNPDKISSLLQDLENIRMDRMKLSIQELAGMFVTLALSQIYNNSVETVKGGDKVYVAKVTNISSMEIFAIKGFISESLSFFREVTTARDDGIATRRRTTFNDNDSNTFGAQNVPGINDIDGEPKRLRKYRGTT